MIAIRVVALGMLLALDNVAQKAHAEMAHETGEYFDLPRLHFVEFSSLEKRAWLRSDCGHPFPVTVGSYVGKNEGRITRITAKAIDVAELVSDKKGGCLNDGEDWTSKGR